MYAALLCLAGGVAYLNSFAGVLVFDDLPAIRDNPTIRSLWPPSVPLSPPPNSGVGGRPLANLSFALNYAWGGTDVRGYHAVNLLLHLSSALLLFGIVRRTLELCIAARAAAANSTGQRLFLPPADATAGGFVVALAWIVHPLATASVTYLSQRTEVLMGFFYFLTLYSFIRGQAAPGRRWYACSILACACGMASKEVMVTAPVLVALYDRTFLTGTFRSGWRLRWRYYAGLAATWLILGYSLSTGLHQRGVGFGLGVSPGQYFLAECEAVVRYVQLTLWPTPLVFDYGRIYPGLSGGALAGALLIAASVWQTVRALRRHSALGFLAAAFFLLLAPTSSFVPVADQPIAENRMYLPLAAALTLAALVLSAFTRRWRTPCLLVCVGLCALTMMRNEDYRSELRLWTRTVQQRPQNARAHFNSGIVRLDAGRPADSLPFFEQALRVNPRHAEAHNSLGNALVQLGRHPEALSHYTEATQLRSGYARAWYNLGTALLHSGDVAAAIPRFEQALRLAPENAEAHINLGNSYLHRGEPARAIPHYEEALRLNPTLADAHYNCGNACLELGRFNDAVTHLSAASRLKPGDAEVRNNLGSALLRAGRAVDAVAELEHALRLQPDYADARSNLEVARREARRTR